MKSVGSEGPDSAELLIVGPAPTAPEVEAGQLFTGKRGSTLWNALRYLKLDRPDVRIINVINEVPLGANNMPTDTQVASNRERFEAEIRASRAKVVLVLGSFALKQTMGLRGKIDDLNGYVFYPSDAKLVPTKARGIVGEYKTSRKCSACAGTGSTTNALTCVKCVGSGYSAKKGDPRYGLIHSSKAPTLPETAQTIIATLHPETIRLMGFKTIHAFAVSVERAVRAMRAGGKIEVVGEDDFLMVPKLPPAGVRQVAVDIENDIESGAIHRIGFAWREPSGIVTWTSPWNMAAKQASKVILGDSSLRKIAHNIMHDASHLEAHGIPMRGEWFCTMQAGATIQPDLLKGLGRMAPIYLDVRTWKEKSEAEPAKYNALDAKIDLLLAEAQQQEISELGMDWVIANTMRVYPTLLKMTKVGINVDTARMQAWSKALRAKLAELRVLWVKEAGTVNFLSNKQLGKYFYNDLGLPMQFNKFGRMSVDDEALRNLMNYAPKHKRKFELVAELRETAKQLSTYASVQTGGDGRVHPRYTPAYKDVIEKFGGNRGGLPATGRLASTGPNIQNQTEEAKLLYIPSRPGMVLVEFDYSQLELRIIAGLSKDKVMQADLDSDIGIHGATQKAFGITNKVVAKAINFGTAYGAGPAKLAKMLQMQGIMINVSEATAFQSKLFSRYTGWYAYRQAIIEEVTAYKRVTTPSGRSRPFYAGKDDTPKALDFPPQSLAADLVLERIPGMDDLAMEHGGNLLSSVHDSFFCEVEEEHLDMFISMGKAHLEAEFDKVAPGFFVPVGIKVSRKSWGEMEKYV